MYTHVGSIEEVRNVEEQFVNKIYNPEFIVEDDDVTDRSGITKDENDAALMNKANGTGLENNAVVMKTACTAVKRKFIDKREANLYTVHVYCILTKRKMINVLFWGIYGAL